MFRGRRVRGCPRALWRTVKLYDFLLRLATKLPAPSRAISVQNSKIVLLRL